MRVVTRKEGNILSVLKHRLDLEFVQTGAPNVSVRHYSEITVSGNHNNTGQVHTIATGSGTTLTKPAGLATIRGLFIKNMDKANSIIFGDQTSQPGFISPGKAAFLEYNATQVLCVASSATLRVFTHMYDKS